MYGGSVCALLERTVRVEQTLCTAQRLALQTRFEPVASLFSALPGWCACISNAA